MNVLIKGVDFTKGPSEIVPDGSDIMNKARNIANDIWDILKENPSTQELLMSVEMFLKNIMDNGSESPYNVSDISTLIHTYIEKNSPNDAGLTLLEDSVKNDKNISSSLYLAKYMKVSADSDAGENLGTYKEVNTLLREVIEGYKWLSYDQVCAKFLQVAYGLRYHHEKMNGSEVSLQKELQTGSLKLVEIISHITKYSADDSNPHKILNQNTASQFLHIVKWIADIDNKDIQDILTWNAEHIFSSLQEPEVVAGSNEPQEESISPQTGIFSRAKEGWKKIKQKFFK